MAPTASSLASLVPATWSALIPPKMAAMPILAGLAVGTAAGASFMSTSGPSPDAAANVSKLAAATAPVVTSPPAALPSAERDCAAQTWPYIDADCLTGAPQEKRAVRIVSAPRPDDAVGARAHGLVSRDTVLRQPQNLNAIPSSEAAPAAREKRKAARKRDRRWTAQSYPVPHESRDRRHSGPVIVVRPLRLNSFR